MKNSQEHASLLNKLCNSLRRQFGAPDVRQSSGPTAELVFACLSEKNPQTKALQALKLLEKHFVDWNEIRVGRESEIAEAMEDSIPNAKETARTIIKLLKLIFDQADTLNLEEIQTKGKREMKAFLEGLDGVTPYIVASVMLHGFNAHAFPVNADMVKMLEAENVIPEKSDLAEIQGFLERHITSNKIAKTYVLLRTYADVFPDQAMPKEKKEKSTKKKTTQKKTKKKTKTKK